MLPFVVLHFLFILVIACMTLYLACYFFNMVFFLIVRTLS